MNFLPAMGFANPFVLAGLLALPVIWWLLRFTPPRPRRQAFPPTRILAELMRRDETRARSPLWLTILRMAIAALVILAMAGPVLNPATVQVATDGPLVIVIDSGWSSTPHRDAMRETANNAIEAADAAGQPVIFAATAPADPNTSAGPFDPAEARDRLAALTSQPIAAGRLATLNRLNIALGDRAPGSVLWLTDGVDNGDAEPFAKALVELAGAAEVSVVIPPASELPLVLDPPLNAAASLDVSIRAPQASGGRTGTIRALDLKGAAIAETPFAFAPGTDVAEARIELPVELRNDIARLEVAESRTAASVHMLDDRWRRRTVGIISGTASERAQPLLSPLYYITRAIGPFADLREPRAETLSETVGELIGQRVSMIVMADIGALTGVEEDLTRWVETGGVLLRFAGPRLAASTDSLIPAKLRRGERNLGGTLSWTEPQPLANFPASSPFADLTPPPDVTVRSQVLAEPSVDLPEKVWAQLADGTPLVTAAPRGRGWVVLFHVTADTAWSNLPLSGTFVEMLRRITALGGTAGAATADTENAAGQREGPVLRPHRQLDGEGNLVAPGIYAEPILAAGIGETVPSLIHPPGLYGSDDGFRALNLTVDSDYQPIGSLPDGITRAAYVTAEPFELTPWLIIAALLLAIADTIAMLVLTGRRPQLMPARGALILALAVLPALGAFPVHAQNAVTSMEDRFALEASLITRLAFVQTGNSEIDRTTRAGLAGLTEMLARRTALEPGSPMAVNISTDELAFFPLIYWAIDPDMAAPDETVINRLNAYLQNGGTILFDTRDASTGATEIGGASAGQAWMRRVLGGLNIPALEPVPGDHVITKSFYLLQEFPGRFEGGPLWVEQTERDPEAPPRPASNADGVSAVLITSNDLAGAWAVTESGQPMYPMSSGSEWQRELAYRVGINIVMYTLTGNYKADQVHIPALLERLGQ
ncbi:MAG: DUF4159 domain-containing protein [Rhodobiaceae bacterium]|nr:DUF4159 domain-containing protein [Rhodobiaceae bacterium]MCC0061298.1 DUF4159 domain-containing protein [Rhodobiaceae bacterium]